MRSLAVQKPESRKAELELSGSAPSRGSQYQHGPTWDDPVPVRTSRNLPVSNLTTQADQIDRTIGQERTFATLCTAFALLAVAIACVGLYGTMAYRVTRRTNEIGLRMALGAERRRLIWIVRRDVISMTAAGYGPAWGASRIDPWNALRHEYPARSNDQVTPAATPRSVQPATRPCGMAQTADV